MAVIGSRDNLNRDPTKMGSFYGGYYQGPRLPAGTTELNPNDADFHEGMTATVTPSEWVANTYVTLYSVSGKGGFLIHALSGATDGANNPQAITFEVTVDGVVHEIALGTSINRGYVRGYLGAVAGTTMENSSWSKSSSSGMAGANFTATTMVYTGGATVGQNINNATIDYGGSSSSTIGAIFLQNLSAPLHAPSTCCRFENSLIVKVKTDTALASNANVSRKYASVLCRLDS